MTAEDYRAMQRRASQLAHALAVADTPPFGTPGPHVAYCRERRDYHQAQLEDLRERLRRAEGA